MESNRSRRYSKFYKKFLAVDRFGESFKMRIDRENFMLQSSLGTLCSVILFLLMIAFSAYKITILESRDFVDILESVEINHFDSDHVFSYNQGFNIAVGVFSPFDARTMQPIDPSYGKIGFYKRTWGQNEDASYFLYEEELKTHLCSIEELG